MSTIASTLKDIEVLQNGIDLYTNLSSNIFVKDLMNFITIVYFEFSAHAVLDSIKLNRYENDTFIKKYYELYLQDGLLDELIRFKNIGHLSIIWIIYEKFLRYKCSNDYSLEERNISCLFEKILSKIILPDSSKIKEEFNIIRNTRNSFHNGGICNKKSRPFSGFLGEKNMYLTLVIKSFR